jgi:hypothetical protein
MTKDQLLNQLKEEILKVQALPETGPSFIYINCSDADSYVKHLPLGNKKQYADYNFHITENIIHFIPSRIGCYESISKGISKTDLHKLICLCWTKSRNGQWKRNPDHRVGECPFRERIGHYYLHYTYH